jgi:ethanolamine ammonia-lyase small subunit
MGTGEHEWSRKERAGMKNSEMLRKGLAEKSTSGTLDSTQSVVSNIHPQSC